MLSDNKPDSVSERKVVLTAHWNFGFYLLLDPFLHLDLGSHQRIGKEMQPESTEFTVANLLWGPY